MHPGLRQLCILRGSDYRRWCKLEMQCRGRRPRQHMLVPLIAMINCMYCRQHFMLMQFILKETGGDHVARIFKADRWSPRLHNFRTYICKRYQTDHVRGVSLQRKAGVLACHLNYAVSLQRVT